MKNLFLTLIVICLGFKMYGQEKNFGIPQRPIKPVISVPKFLESVNLKDDIEQLKVLKDIYQELKKDSASAVYQYSFYVDTTGKIVLSIPEEKAFLLPVNKYVESIFINYRWKPAYRLNCNSCLVKTFGELKFFFNTDENHVACVISIINEKEYKVFNEKIDMR